MYRTDAIKMVIKITQPHQSAIDSKLDELLIAWHQWQRSYRPSKGYAGSDATCRDYQTPTHWDWRNGALDGRVDGLQAKAVNEAMGRVPDSPQRWHTALSIQARNLASGYAVWSSPVLPRNRHELDTLIIEARSKALIELQRAGFFE